MDDGLTVYVRAHSAAAAEAIARDGCGWESLEQLQIVLQWFGQSLSAVLTSEYRLWAVTPLAGFATVEVKQQ